LVPFTKIERAQRIPKLGIKCPERLFNNLVVGANGMSFNEFAKIEDMILTPITGL
jgi:hypothetical protein